MQKFPENKTKKGMKQHNLQVDFTCNNKIPEKWLPT